MDNFGKASNSKPTISILVKGKPSKPSAERSLLAKELREQISQLRTELSSQRSGNQQLLRKKILELKEAQRGADVDHGSGKKAPTVLNNVSEAMLNVSDHSLPVIRNGKHASKAGQLSDVRKSSDGPGKTQSGLRDRTTAVTVDQKRSIVSSDDQPADLSKADPSRNVKAAICDFVRPPVLPSSSSCGEPVGDSNEDCANVCTSNGFASHERRSFNASETDDDEERIASLSRMLNETDLGDGEPSRRRSLNKINGKEDKDVEKQWQLQKKVFDLTAQMSLLDKRLAAVKEENEFLKKKGEELKLSEEKVTQLKRRNTELTAAVRKLEEKVKQLQQDSLKKSKGMVSPSQDASANYLRSSRILVRDKSKNVHDKDKTIEILREKCQELIRLLGSQQKTFEQYTSSNELELAVKQAAKERLQLEKKLTESQRVNPVIEAKLQRLTQLEDVNNNLENEVAQLSEELNQKEKMEMEFIQRNMEFDIMSQELDDMKRQYAGLEKDLTDVLDKNMDLAVANSDMQQQIVELETVKSQYDKMESMVKASESEAKVAKSEVIKLNSMVETLRHQLQVMADEKAKLTIEKEDAVNLVNQKQQEVDILIRAKERQEIAYKNNTAVLEIRIVKLEEQCAELKTNKFRLVKEINELKELPDTRQSRGRVAENESIRNSNNHNKCSLDGMRNGRSSLADDYDSVDRDYVSESNCESYSSTNRNGVSNADQSTPVRVFVVLYDYDPDQSSPNEQPDLELCLRTGEYVFVYGDVDEDGFFEGELADGRRGLVPSNFVAQLNNEDAAEQLAMMADENGPHGFILHDSTNNTSFLQELDISNEEFDGVVSIDRAQGQTRADPPFSVQIERGPDHGSLIVSWLPVTIAATGTSNGLLVRGYNVLVNGVQVKQLLSATGDHVLLEYEDLCELESPPRYVTVRTLAMSGQESVDSPRACLSSKMIRELKAMSLQSDSEMDEMENQLSPVAAPVLRPVAVIAKASTYLNTLGSITSQEHSNANLIGNTLRTMHSATLHSTVIHSVNDNVNATNRALSEPPDARPSDEGLPCIRANTVPPSLEALSLSTLDACRAATDDKETAERTNRVNAKVFGRSLIDVPTNGGGKTQDCSCQMNRSGQEGGNCQFLQVDSKCPMHSPAVRKPGPMVANLPLAQATAFSMTALDTAILSNHGMGISPSSLKLGGSGVWRRVQRRDSGLVAAAEQVDDEDDTMSNQQVDVPNLDRQHLTESEPVRQQPLDSSSRTKSSPGTGGNDIGERDAMNAGGSVIIPPKSTTSLSNGVMVFSSSAYSAVVGDVNEPDADVEGSELADNNAVTNRFLRDDIPDSELIDYSDDGGESLVGNGGIGVVGPEQVRIFVALFDYDPYTMSPNPDAIDVEIPFHEGQIIQVYGDQDADGFYVGECNGRRGLIPSNMVSVVEVDDPEIALHLLQNSCVPVLTNGSLSSSRASSRASAFTTQTMSTISQQDNGSVALPRFSDDSLRYMIALYNYDPQELSPNMDADQELAFDRGQIIAIYGDVDDDGFYFGEVNGQCGLVPSNFVQPVPPDFISSMLS